MASLENRARVAFKSNNQIPNGTNQVAIGKYDIELNPCENNSEGIVSFGVESGQDPKDIVFVDILFESEYFLSFLSVASRSNCKFSGGLLDFENIVRQKITYGLTRKTFDFNEVKHYYDKLCSLAEEDKERFVHACVRYRQAISIWETEPVVTFFLFVVAVECLSNSMVLNYSNIAWDVYRSFYGDPNYPRGKMPKAVKFVEFLCKYLPPEALKNEGDIMKLKMRLLSAYFIRSSFVHDGAELPQPVKLADHLRKKSVVYSLRKQGKKYEIRAPGICWLESIVNCAFKCFLESESGKTTPTDIFRDQAKKSGRFDMKRRKDAPPIEKWQAIDDGLARLLFEIDE